MTLRPKITLNMRFLLYLHPHTIIARINMTHCSLYLVVIIPLLSIVFAIIQAHWATKHDKVSKCFAWLYRIELIFPFLWIAVFSLGEVLPLSTVFIFLTAPVAVGCGETMKKVAINNTTAIIGSLHLRTLRFLAIFSILFAASLFLGRFF